MCVEEDYIQFMASYDLSYPFGEGTYEETYIYKCNNF